MLNTAALSAGSTLRFLGLMFNDNGALRMDCAQVSDGVTATMQSNAAKKLPAGAAQISRQAGINGLPQIVTTVTRSR
ncbi:MAG TPA: hypothetical protein VGG04_16270 [Candidatus Sulfotelmatobacter sp.]|jgi:hypothetical protein